MQTRRFGLQNFLGCQQIFEGHLVQLDGKQFWNLMKFGVVIVEPMLGLFDLGGILWYQYCMFQVHQNIF